MKLDALLEAIDRGADPTKAPARRVNWCSRCSLRGGILREAQPGGSMCAGCAPLVFKAAVALKIGAANALGRGEDAKAWLAIQHAEEQRVVRGGKGRAEYPFTAEERAEGRPAKTRETGAGEQQRPWFEGGSQ